MHCKGRGTASADAPMESLCIITGLFVPCEKTCDHTVTGTNCIEDFSLWGPVVMSMAFFIDKKGTLSA